MARRSGIAITFTGGQSLADGLRALGEFGSERISRAAMKRAMVKALEPVRDAAIAKAPKGGDGDLAKSIVISSRLTRRQKRNYPTMSSAGWDKVKLLQTVFVGPGAGGSHGVLVEFGTQEREHANGKSVGRAAAQPFMRPAWEQNKTQVLTTFQGFAWREIAKSTERIRRKQARARDKVTVPRS